ncbi:hypothetical protein ACVWZ9_001955 [Pseudomonas chlororaphis]
MNESVLIGIDLGKHSFHLYGQNASAERYFARSSRERSV